MILDFYIRFSTKYGQSLGVSGNADELGNDDPEQAFPLLYLNDQFWYGQVEIDPAKLAGPLNYRYILRESDNGPMPEFGDDRVIDITNIKTENIILTDTWNDSGQIENVFYTSAFRDVLLKRKKTKDIADKKSKRNFTHEFRVKAPLLGEHEVLCMSGGSAALKDWDTENMTLLSKNGNWWSARLDLSKARFPMTYKYGIYNTKENKFIGFEEGNNRVLSVVELGKANWILHDGFARFNNARWKGTGVAIPVFSLRSKDSFGSGEFTDLKLLVDWAKTTGLKMIQLLPVNDTTSTLSWKDSYPYSAISAFALHPMKGAWLTNRTPTPAELRLGKPLLEQFLSMFPNAKTIAVGDVSEGVLGNLGVTIAGKVRHPANGGTAQFREEVAELLRHWSASRTRCP